MNNSTLATTIKSSVIVRNTTTIDVKEVSTMKNNTTIESILSTLKTIVRNATTINNIIAFFGGEKEFDMNKFFTVIESEPETLRSIEGVGKVISAKLVAAFACDKTTYHITHYSIDGTSTVECHATNMAFRYAISHGLDPEKVFLFVDSVIDSKHSELKTVWYNMCHDGITINDVKFMPLCATASGAKKAQSIWCDEQYLKMFSKHFRHGFKINGVAMEPNKFFTRLGLFFSSSKKIEEVYPNFTVDFDKMHIMSDVYRNGHNATDSACFVFDGTNNLPSEAASLRPTKVLAVPVNKKVFLDALGFDPEYKDPWGNTHKLSKTQVLLSESGEKFISLAESEPVQVRAIKEAGVSVAVRMNKHGLKHVTYQPLQTLAFSDENVKKLQNIGIKYLEGLSDIKNYVKLLPATMREAVTIYPQLVMDEYVKKAGQTAYRKQKMMLRGGALPQAGRFHAITCDPIDLFGGNGLKAGQCSCKALPEGKVVMLRYPHTSEASWVVLDNIHMEIGISDRNVLVLNNYDESLRRLGGADYDGDKVLVVTDEEIRSIILETLNQMDNPTEMPNTPAGHARKLIFDKTNANAVKMAYFTNLVKMSQIGSVSNRLSAAYANLYEAYISGDEKAIALAKEHVLYWQMRVEITVDIEKHGDTTLAVPEGTNEASQKLPKFVMYAKLAKSIDKPVQDVIDRTKYELRSDSPMEQYSMFVDENSAHAKDFTASVSGDFMWNNLLYDAAMPVLNTKVFKRSEVLRDENGRIVKDENGNAVFVDGGVFDKIVFATSDELRAKAQELGLEYDSVEDIRKQMIDKLIAWYAKKNNCTEQQVYNLIVWYIYQMSEGKAVETYKRVMWATLSDYIVDALTERFGQIALATDFEELDNGEDTDEDVEF